MSLLRDCIDWCEAFGTQDCAYVLRSESGLDFHSTSMGPSHVPSPRQDRLPVFGIRFLESAIQLLKQ